MFCTLPQPVKTVLVPFFVGSLLTEGRYITLRLQSHLVYIVRGCHDTETSAPCQHYFVRFRSERFAPPTGKSHSSQFDVVYVVLAQRSWSPLVCPCLFPFLTISPPALSEFLSVVHYSFACSCTIQGLFRSSYDRIFIFFFHVVSLSLSVLPCSFLSSIPITHRKVSLRLRDFTNNAILFRCRPRF